MCTANEGFFRSKKMSDWHNAGALDALEENIITELEVDGKKLCVLLKDNQVYSFAATCPHTGARLCEGWLDVQKRVVCPLHKYRFDPANGRNTSGEGYKLKTFPIMMRGEEIYVQF